MACNSAAGRTFTTRRFLNSLDNRALKHDDGQDLSIRSGLQSTRAERFETLRDNTAFPGLLLTCACQKLHQPQDWVVQEGIEGPERATGWTHAPCLIKQRSRGHCSS